MIMATCGGGGGGGVPGPYDPPSPPSLPMSFLVDALKECCL